MRRPRPSNRKNKKLAAVRHDATPSVFTCPDCQGTLFMLNNGGLPQFRCRIGHLYSPEAMLEAQDDNVERLMWSANRALEEQSEYLSQMAEQIASAKNSPMAEHYRARSRSALEKADMLRELITADSGHRERNAVADPDRE